jgi:hypothetical protein
MSVIDLQRHEMETCDILRERHEMVIDNAFPTDYGFTICIDPYELDEVIFEQSSVKLRYKFDCYCWDEHNKLPKNIKVTNEDGRSITYRDCIQRLIDVRFTTKCNHRWLEGFGEMDANGWSEISMRS